MQRKAQLDNYLVLKTLGTGYTGKVKLCQEMSSNNLFALKILDPTKMETEKLAKVVKSLENELAVMRRLNHKNIVNFLGLNTDGLYTTKKGTQKKVAYATIELAGKGEMFEVLFKVGPFNENMSRYYMRQLVDALSYLHLNKVAHRDLKPENLLMDDEYNLKLADFGFATLFDAEMKNKTKLGTERYMSPELLCRKPYSAASVDIFAAGVVLFIFFSGHPPFHEAKLDDPYYKVFINNKQRFWDFHSKQNKKREYSENFKALVNGMMEFDPEKRFTIEQVQASEWLSDTIDDTKALQDMADYIRAMTKTVNLTNSAETKVSNLQKKSTRSQKSSNSDKKCRSGELHAKYDKVETESIGMAQKNNPNVICVKSKNKAELINSIVNAARNLINTKVIWNDAKDKFKIKFNTEYGEVVLVKVRIYEGRNGLFKIEFAKLQGPCFDYYRFKARFREFLGENL